MSVNIAVFGGSFDPIHHGHLILAQEAALKYNSKIILMPSGHSPFKENEFNKDHRYKMALLAAGSNPLFHVSDLEIKRQGRSYTADTLKEVRNTWKCDKLYFILGTDTLETLASWKNYKEILSLCEFITATRKGFGKNSLKIRELQNMGAKIHFMDFSVTISSTNIRNKIERNQPVNYLLPDTVESYIKRNNLYKEIIKPNFAAIDAYLTEYLSNERYEHTINVVKETISLAAVHKENLTKARIAAMLHDCAKEYPPDALEVAYEKYNLQPDILMRNNVNLSHGFLGAEIARKKFHITDVDILNAIRYHTTGRKNMSLLEKIVYLGDLTEPSRKGTEKFRHLAYTDINAAMALALETTIYNVTEKKLPLHPLTLEAYEDFIT